MQFRAINKREAGHEKKNKVYWIGCPQKFHINVESVEYKAYVHYIVDPGKKFEHKHGVSELANPWLRLIASVTTPLVPLSRIMKSPLLYGPYARINTPAKKFARVSLVANPPVVPIIPAEAILRSPRPSARSRTAAGCWVEYRKPGPPYG